ncbi:ATP-binding cassette domain-containing protein [Carboxydochorda subterranea]|uniref:ATP-binding cassette domain-containing protein n=1 Tax=Carboxydichorda subterranea TaxID=3109565 RepID=A0ABZ1BZ81_9FIRM|nr:ATP-binding cassette domain-containing protein [Limnochorda sp. L945t]WRP17377.1 ATP-binding cassette domain-containing protein [Limnochorda sp. L945t]
MSEWAIRTDGLTKHYGRVRALEEIHLRVPAGRIYGFVGPNGSGKTTAIASVLGLIRPTRGSIEVLGVCQGSRDFPAALAQVGALVQAPAFYPYLSGRDNLRVLGSTRSMVSDRDIDEALSMVGLTERANDRYQFYSLGMRQRLAIALALIGHPRLVILDEPTNGLDPFGIQEVRQLIRGLGAQGLTVFLSSHLLYEVEQVCDEVGVIVQGRLVAQGPVEELLRTRGIRIRVSPGERHNGHPEGVDGHNGALARAAARLIEQLPWRPRVQVQGESVWVDAPPDKGAELTRVLASQGLWISELVPVRSTLEQYFMELATGRQAEGGVRS